MRHALLFPLLLASCAGASSSAVKVDTQAWSIPALVADDAVSVEVLFPAGSVSSVGPLEGGIGGVRHPEASGWIDFVATFPECGRWRTEVMFADGPEGEVTAWAGRTTSQGPWSRPRPRLSLPGTAPRWTRGSTACASTMTGAP